MDNVHHGAAIPKKRVQQFLIIGIPVGIENVVVNPNPVDQIQRLLTLPVILIKRVIEIVLQNRINPDCVGSHILDLAKPPKIHFLIYGVIRCPLSRHPHPHIHASHLKRDILLSLFQTDIFSVNRHKRGDGHIGGYVYVDSMTVINGVSQKKEGYEDTNSNDIFFHDLQLSKQMRFLNGHTPYSANNAHTVPVRECSHPAISPVLSASSSAAPPRLHGC